jgi:delta(3,5)-delta(2,4)-dienoyl-CoA isomerase
LGITADLGVLQLLPKIVGNDSLARELAYTGRKLYADEAKELGLVRFVMRSFLSLSTRR